MSADPKVTVIVPVHNGARYVAATLESALAQTMGDFELLVLDNVSTDETPEIVARFPDARLRYIRNETNLGLAGNVRRGLELARGTFVTILGADDIWLPGFLAAAVAFLESEPGVTLVHGPAAWIDETGQRFGDSGYLWQRRTPGRRAMLEAFSTGFCFATMVMRSSAVRSMGPFDDRWREVVDLWLFLRMCLLGDIGFLPATLCEYRVHASSMSMPMYRENLMFRRQMDAAREAFAWPEAVRLGAAGQRRQAERSAARIALETLHLARPDGRARYLRNFAEVVRQVPGILADPATWLRLGFGMLPTAAIEGLRNLRRRRSLALAGRPSRGGGS